MHHGLAELRGDFHGRMLPTRRGAADQERNSEASTLHLARDEYHFVERRRDKSTQADEIGVLVDSGLKNPVGGHHDAQVDDLITVAAENDADDILADVADVTFHSRHDNLAR